MIITVELFGVHRETAGVDRLEFPVGENALVRDALAYIGEKFPFISLDDPSVIVTVNHEVAYRDRPLRPGDNICVLPHIGGG